jgi:hypothetical protein
MAKTNEQLTIELVLKTEKVLDGFAKLGRGTEQYNLQLLKTIALMEQLSAKTGKSYARVSGAFLDPTSNISQDTMKMRQASLNEFGNTVDKVATKTENMGKKAGNAAQGFNVLRSAMGFITAMGMSAIIGAIAAMFKKATDSIMQLEKAVMNLAIAEKALSRAGVEIVPEDFEDIAKAVRATGISISEIDLTNLIANTAAGTRDLKLSVTQLKNLSVAVAAIAYANGKTVEEVQNTIQTSLTTSGRGLKPLDIPVDAAMIKEKAIEAQLVKNAEAYDKLTAAQKQKIETDALLLIIDDNANQILAESDILLGSVTSTTKQVSTAWENFTTSLGEVLKFPLVGFGTALILYLQVWSNGLVMLGIGFGEFMGAIVGGISVIDEFTKGNIKSIEDMSAAYTKASDEMKTTIFSGMFPGGVPDLKFGTNETGLMSINTGELYKKYKKSTDTPTSPQTGSPEGISPEDTAKMQEAFDKFAQDLVESQIKLAQDLKDTEIELGRDLVDIDTEYNRKRIDVQKDYEDKVRDINQSYNEDIVDIKQKQAEDEQKRKNDDLKREQEYQNKLLEMRENYLMSLDDALHSRDARQVLKLMHQYELDKLQAARRHDLDNQQAAADEKLRRQEIANEIKKAQNKREMALKEAQQERDDKLAQMVIDEKREIEDARLKAKRKNDDLRKANSDRAALMAAQLAWEQKYTGEWMTRMLRLYGQYYTNIAQVYRNLRAMESAGALAQGGAATLPTGISTTQNDPRRGRSAGRAAEGGIFSASSPTTLRFGEAGAEVASVMPLNRIGKNVGKLMSGSLPGGSGAGKMTIELLLSPDLESRIVANSLNETANIITRIQRSK